MTNENDNGAKRCAKTLRLYNDEWDDRANLIDFLADARHWCDRNNEDFDELDRIACGHYLAELDNTSGR